MNDEESTQASRCVFCGYDLAGLVSTICPECGKEQPPQSDTRLVRADRLWFVLALAGLVSFGLLARVALALGKALGAAYTGDLELVGLTCIFAAACAGYAILVFEVLLHREKLKRLRPATRATVAGVIAMPRGLALGFLLLLIASNL